MEFLDLVFKFLSQPDQILSKLIEKYDNWIYAILFLLVFAETGLIVMSFLMPFLPGDALIFAIGMIAARGELDITIVIPLLIIAALLGDNVNYYVGRRFGTFILNSEKTFIIRKSHIKRAQEFFEKNGRNSIIIARFIPVVRTIVPFLSGATNVPYKTFLKFSFIGAVLWVALISLLGYFLGQIEYVKEHLEKFIILIIIVANLPLLKQLFISKKAKNE
ncbi:VTT domain-containing protein [Flavobacterium sp.]|jgi:membrane-associated protein|uniref:VTT domain-containing protein n=1 Tax=Flavobacterium sp. TaxID=239 RepID=UPI0037C0B341